MCFINLFVCLFLPRVSHISRSNSKERNFFVNFSLLLQESGPGKTNRSLQNCTVWCTMYIRGATFLFLAFRRILAKIKFISGSGRIYTKICFIPKQIWAKYYSCIFSFLDNLKSLLTVLLLGLCASKSSHLSNTCQWKSCVAGNPRKYWLIEVVIF